MITGSTASGDDHASTRVPPQLLERRPNGTLYVSYISRPKNQQTAEKYPHAPPLTDSVKWI